MKKFNGISSMLNAIKLILKYAGYVTIIIEIANFAISKIAPLVPENVPNENVFFDETKQPENA